MTTKKALVRMHPMPVKTRLLIWTRYKTNLQKPSKRYEELRQLRTSLPKEMQQCVGNDIKLLNLLTRSLITKVPHWSLSPSSLGPSTSPPLSSNHSWQQLHETYLKHINKFSPPCNRGMLLLATCKRCSKVLHVSAFSLHLRRCQRAKTVVRTHCPEQSVGTKRSLLNADDNMSYSNSPPSKRRRLSVNNFADNTHTPSDLYQEGVKRKVTSHDMKRLVAWISTHRPQPLIRLWPSVMQRIEHHGSSSMTDLPLGLTFRIRHRLKRNGVSLLAVSQTRGDDFDGETTATIGRRLTSPSILAMAPTVSGWVPAVVGHGHTTEFQYRHHSLPQLGSDQQS